VTLTLALLAGGLAERALYRAIRSQAEWDEARPADAIVVFGAAEYNGTPSPVFKSRLDHTFELEERGLAGLVITTGGPGGDRRFTEGGVGRDYLIQQGMAESKIVAETNSDTTFESVRAAALVLQAHHLRTCLVVSDGFHIYRLKKIFRSLGITAYGSPAPASPIEADPVQRTMHSLRELVITTLWFLGFHGS
jgi:uncharacterized SAM-binding protein YcdF (DUF218 family)